MLSRSFTAQSRFDPRQWTQRKALAADASRASRFTSSLGAPLLVHGDGLLALDPVVLRTEKDADYGEDHQEK